MKLRRSARRVGVSTEPSWDAWYYENAKSIDVYVRPVDGGQTLSCRIRRAVLQDWLDRTEPKEGG